MTHARWTTDGDIAEQSNHHRRIILFLGAASAVMGVANFLAQRVTRATRPDAGRARARMRKVDYIYPV